MYFTQYCAHVLCSLQYKFRMLLHWASAVISDLKMKIPFDYFPFTVPALVDTVSRITQYMSQLQCMGNSINKHGISKADVYTVYGKILIQFQFRKSQTMCGSIVVTAINIFHQVNFPNESLSRQC